MKINNKKYWNQRFATDWESKFGREQSRFFARIAIENLPEWFTSYVLTNYPTICDWGCAEGDGTDILASHFRQKHIQGIDFSDIAIRKAKQYFPELTFKSEDWLKMKAPAGAQYDIIFSSNTLEHFSEPQAIFKTISRYARQMVVLMLPFREFERLDEHYYTFLPENIQIVPTSDFVLLHSKIINTSGFNPTYWTGEQIILIYGQTDWVSGSEIPLSQIFMDIKLSQALIGVDGQLQDISRMEEVIQVLSSQVAEKDQMVQTLVSNVAEMEKVIQVFSSQVAEKEQMVQTLASNVTELEKVTQVLSSQAADHESQIEKYKEMVNVRDQGIAWLRGELVLVQTEIRQIQANIVWRYVKIYLSFRTWVSKKSFPIRHPVNWIMQDEFRRRNVQLLPDRIKQFLKRLLKYPIAFEARLMSNPEVINKVLLDKERKHGDFYDGLHIYPRISDEQLDLIQKHRGVEGPLYRPDIICFSIIDWDFRYQRPQQIMSKFAANGHRIFYISTTRFQSAGASPAFVIKIIKENVFEISLTAQRPPDVYGESIGSENLEPILTSLAELRHVCQIDEAISYVMIASWTSVALATQKWNWKVVYDCMDEWNNFPMIKRAIVDAELRLVQKCDLLVVTSQRLYENWEKYDRPMVLARNAADYKFYEQRFLPNDILPKSELPLIGYYGAIADWFDLELMTYVAKNRPNYSFILVGGVFNLNVSGLKALPNVQLLGQQPYEAMPLYLYHFDACIIPFKLNSITEATDPVKIYEYFSGGKPVVSVELPELNSYAELLYLAKNKDDFLAKLDEAVVEDNPDLITRRKEFAEQNTWDKRYEQIIEGIRSVTFRASIIVVTFENLTLTKLCLESIIRNTEYLNYEIIVVDNNSNDGTQDYLKNLAKQHSNLRIILNSANNGFAKANNQGLSRAMGEYLILLNNDTIVPPGWLSRLVSYLNDPQLGLVGPMTNFAGNEAKVNVTYKTWGEMESFAKDYIWKNEGHAAEIHMLAMYCVAFRRDVYQIVGPLDEQFGIGMFEDDDYSQRIRQKGYKIICAQDVFVHHFGQAAFGKLIRNNTYDRLFDENRRRYEAKWNVKWVIHKTDKLNSNYHPGSSAFPDLRDDHLHQISTTIDQKDDYAQKILRENIKWGQHLKVEASGKWHAWLDHPMIRTHYQELSLIDNISWKEWIPKYLGSPAEKSLDLGCGAGARSLDLWQAGSTKFIEGIDVSESRVEEGERNRQELGAPGLFKVLDVNTVILPENTYDVIFSAHSFHHFLELEHVLEQISRALKEKGLFILEEFVGPSQFQWTDLQMKYTKYLISSLPHSLRNFRDGRLKLEEGRPTPDEVAAVSPFESIRSAEIWSLFQKYFEVIAVRKLGGTLQHLLYNGIVHNFEPGNPIADQHIQRIIEAEDTLIHSGKLPSDFMLLVGRRLRINV